MDREMLLLEAVPKWAAGRRPERFQTLQVHQNAHFMGFLAVWGRWVVVALRLKAEFRDSLLRNDWIAWKECPNLGVQPIFIPFRLGGLAGGLRRYGNFFQ